MCDVVWKLGDFDHARRREGQEDMILVAEAMNGREQSGVEARSGLPLREIEVVSSVIIATLLSI